MLQPLPWACCVRACTQPSNPFAALGNSGATGFGTGGFTFGDLSASAAPAKPAAEEDGDEGGDEPAAEEECQVQTVRSLSTLRHRA